MAALHKEVCGCTRKSSESISSSIKRFVGAAQAYFNLANSDRESAERQNPAMLLLSYSKVAQSTLTAIMNNLIQYRKDKASRKHSSTIPHDSDRVEKILTTLEKFQKGKVPGSTMLQEHIDVLGAAQRRLTKRLSEYALWEYISLSDEVGALEEAIIDFNGEESNAEPPKVDVEEPVHTFLAQTKYAKKFNNDGRSPGQ